MRLASTQELFERKLNEIRDKTFDKYPGLTFLDGYRILLPLLLEAYEALLEIEDVNHCDAEIDSSKREELAREALARIEAFANG